MEEEQENPSIYQHAAKFGLFLAGISIALVVVLYAVDYSIMVTFKFIGLILLITLGFTIYAGINFRTSIGGFMPYGQALLHGIVIMAVAGLISTGFNILLYQVIDPELPQKMIDAVIVNTEEMMQRFGASGDGVDQALDKVRDDMGKQFTVVGQLFSYVKAFIGYIIIGLISALFVRKNQPEAI